VGALGESGEIKGKAPVKGVFLGLLCTLGIVQIVD
jgi:hypothetical protein